VHPPERLGIGPGLTPQLSRPSFTRTLRLASTSAASTAACASSSWCLRVAYSGSLSQWFASPLNAAISPTSAERSRAVSLATSFGSCGPNLPLHSDRSYRTLRCDSPSLGTSSSGSRSILMMCGGSVSGATCRVAPDEVMQFMELRR
jgi:hypothetical protein